MALIFLVSVIVLGFTMHFGIEWSLKRDKLEAEKNSKLFDKSWNLVLKKRDLEDKLHHKIKHYQFEDEGCLSLLEEYYAFCKENNFDTNKLFFYLSIITQLRFEKFVKNPDFAIFCASTKYFSDIYNTYDEVNIDPKEYFEKFIVGLTKHYNHSYGKSVGKEFIENSFDMEGFVKDIEQIHKIFVRIKTGA